MVSTFWNNKNVFITGGTGFLGSYLVKKLVNYGANVTILVRDYIPQSNIYRGEEYKKVNVVLYLRRLFINRKDTWRI